MPKIIPRPAPLSTQLRRAALCAAAGLVLPACGEEELAIDDPDASEQNFESAPADSEAEKDSFAVEEQPPEDADSDGRLPDLPGGEFDPTLVADRDSGDICGSLDWIDVENASSSVQKMAESVGHFRVQFGGQTSACSGTLISENVFLTAGHCVDVNRVNNQLGSSFANQAALCASTQVVFNFQNVGGSPASSQPSFGCASIIQSSDTSGYDYALVQLTGSPGQTFGFLEADFRRPVEDDPITIIHHPSLMVKKVSTDTIRDVTNRHIKHRADTQGGSSGAPIIVDGRIIGIHERGGCSVPGYRNRGFTMERIYTDANWLQTVDYFDQDEDDVREQNDGFGSTVVLGDFNGDKFDDIAVGTPDEGIGLMAKTGWVSIREGGNRGLRPQTQFGFDQQGSTGPENYDHFGETLAVGDFDNDGFDDLVIGTPRENNNAIEDSGVVHVSMGSVVGLGTGSMDAFWPSQLSGNNTEDGNFGWALAVGDFNDDGFDDLAIGAPGEGADGVVYTVYGSASGLTTSGHDRFTQSSTSTNQADGGQFGYALAAGDVNGDGDDDLIIGSPYEDIGSLDSAGYVTVVHGRFSGLNLSNTDGFEQSIGTGSEAGDRFGEVIVAGDFNNDGFDDVAFGLPHENKGSQTDAGYICVHHGDASGLVPKKGFSRSSLDGSPAPYDRLGQALAVGDLDGDGRDDLIIGAPGDDTDAPASGQLFVGYGSSGGVSTSGSDEFDITDVGTPTWLDALGSVSSLATGDVDGDGDDDMAAGIAAQSTSNAIGAGAVMVLDVE